MHFDQRDSSGIVICYVCQRPAGGWAGRSTLLVCFLADNYAFGRKGSHHQSQAENKTSGKYLITVHNTSSFFYLITTLPVVVISGLSNRYK
jgi:hypothetical protein